MHHKFLAKLTTKVITIIVSITIILGAFSYVPVKSQTQNRGLVVGPTITDFDADRGTSYPFEVLVENDSDKEMNIKVSLQTFEASAQEGQPTIKNFAPDSEIPQWFQVSQKEFTLASKQRFTSQVTINIPTEALPGSYYFALTYASKDDNQNSDGTRVSLEARIQSLFFVNVKGKTNRDVKFDTFQTQSKVYDPFFDSIQLDYKIAVSGNTYLRPSGNIYINTDGSESSLDINPNQKIILPNSVRSFGYLSKAQWNLPNINNQISSKDIVYSDLDIKPKWFGNQTIKGVIIYANSNGDGLEKKEVNLEIFFFPWKLLGLVVPLIIFIIALVFAGLRIYRISLGKK